MFLDQTGIETPEIGISRETQIEILRGALRSSFTPLEFYERIGPYLVHLSPDVLGIYKSKMWVKYLKGIRDNLSLQGLKISKIRRALAQLEGAFYLLNGEIKRAMLRERDQRILEDIEAVIMALKVYKEISYFIKNMKEESKVNPSQVSLYLARAKKMIKPLESGKTPYIPGLPHPQELWNEVRNLILNEWLETTLAREENFIKGMQRDISSLNYDMDRARDKGRRIEVEELEGLLEKYFSLVIRYNRAVKEYKHLKGQLRQKPPLLEIHRKKLEEIRVSLDKLKITKFLALLISGRELLSP